MKINSEDTREEEDFDYMADHAARMDEEFLERADYEYDRMVDDEDK